MLSESTPNSAIDAITERDRLDAIENIEHASREFSAELTIVAALDQHTEEELEEYGPNLRSFIENAIASKREVEQMLAFPEDPFYDLRALEKSGIDDPYEAGMILREDDIHMDEVRHLAGVFK